jgi:CIC family chloride channel protein
MKDKVLKIVNTKILDKFQTYRNWIFAFIGGGVIGTIMLISPYAVFSGHELVKILINDSTHFPLFMIFVLIVLRIIATTISIYANAVGGIFIALMSIGALVGYGFSEVLINLGLHIEPFYFAAIGAAVFVGVNMKLPLTAIVMALEITYDYNVIIPTGFSVVIVTYLVSLNFELKKLKFLKYRK